MHDEPKASGSGSNDKHDSATDNPKEEKDEWLSSLAKYFAASDDFPSQLRDWQRNLPEAGVELTKDKAYSLLFDRIMDFWLENVDYSDCTTGEPLPFPLRASIVNEKGVPTTMKKYEARPDVALLKHDFPRFLADFETSKEQQGLHRLIIQLVCSLRLAGELRKIGTPRGEIFLMGAFVTKQREIERLFVYFHEESGDKNEPGVGVSTRTFKIDSPLEFMAFLVEFCNYAMHIGDEDRLLAEDVGNVVKRIRKNILKEDLPTLRTKSHSIRKESSRSGRIHGSHSDNSVKDALVEALEDSDIKVQVLPEGFERMEKLPADVEEAFTSDGTHVVAKLIKKQRDELYFIKKLSAIRSPQNHVIPLLDTVPSRLGEVMILPWGHVLNDFFRFSWIKNYEGKTMQFCRELVEGVAFLHRQMVAHLDIKPSNIVYSHKDERLYIIDFDVAYECEDAEELVRIGWGTEGWCAPEIVLDNKKRRRRISPIRADLWSCGAVIRYMDERSDEVRDGDIKLLVQLLLDRVPKRRPLLHELVDEEPDFWTSGRLRKRLDAHVRGNEAREKEAQLKRARGASTSSSISSERPPAKLPRESSNSPTQPPIQDIGKGKGKERA